MKKTKRYERTRFTVSHLRDAIAELGENPRLLSAEIMTDDVTVSYDSLQNFLAVYAEGCSSALVSVESKNGSILLNNFLGTSNVTVESDNAVLVDGTLARFDSFAPCARLAEEEEQEGLRGFDVDCFCVVSPLHWESLPHLPAHLAQHGIAITEQSVRITRYPTIVRYTEWAPVLADIRQNGEPKRFVVTFGGKWGKGNCSLIVRKAKDNNCDKMFVCLEMSGVKNMEVVDDTLAFLGIQPDEASPRSQVDRTAFIAHRFDELGEQLADRLARFLSLLGFNVQTGRGFSPKSVSEKVRERLHKQSIVFAILTPGDDATWLTQESVIGYSREKPLFVLCDTNADFKPGILGDLEYIPFAAPRIEGAFIAVLEGLKELGFLKTAWK